MPARQDNDSAPRPLLVNGEALSLDVRTPPSGGGEKFNPRTVQEAQELLTPQVTAVSQAVEGMPQYLRAKDHVYVEARLLANYLAASYFPAELFNRIGAVPVGSRADMGSYVTKAKGPEAKQTRRLIVAVSDDGVSELRGLIVEGGRYGARRSRRFKGLMRSRYRAGAMSCGPRRSTRRFQPPASACGKPSSTLSPLDSVGRCRLTMTRSNGGSL